MTIIISLIAAAFIAAAPAAAQGQAKEFEIIGNISGFRDSTYISLYDFATGYNVFMDSAQIIHGRFVFRGLLSHPYQKLGLDYTTKTSEGYQSDLSIFWVEGGTVHFTAKKGDFRKATITGSPMQEESNLLAAIVARHPDKEKETYIDYIKAHPNSLIAAEILQIYCKTWGRDTTQLLYDGFSEKVRQSPFGKSIYSFLSLSKNIQIGDRFVDFTMPNIRGENISLSDYKNKYVLLDFWGSWCGPCRAENPNLVKTYREFRDKGFDILGVSVEANKKWWGDAMQKDSISWESVSDLKGQDNEAVLIYGIDHYPANFLIDPGGVIIAKDLRGDALRNKLAELLQ